MARRRGEMTYTGNRRRQAQSLDESTELETLGLGSRWYRLEGRTPVRCVTLHDLRMQEAADRRVAQTTMVDGTWVSTVFLGLDHGWSEEGPPVLFESMVFADGDTAREEGDYTRRYNTFDEAEAGHAEIVDQVMHDHDTTIDVYKHKSEWRVPRGHAHRSVWWEEDQ